MDTSDENHRGQPGARFPLGATVCTCGTTGRSGPESGGQSFKLCGANFQALAAVEFDGCAASGRVTVNATTITCTGTPPRVPGGAAVRVRNPDPRAGYLPALYTDTGGSSRAGGLRVAKSGNDALLTRSCAGRTAPPPKVFRSRNAPFTLNAELCTGGAASYTSAGALAAGSNPAHFRVVE